MRMTPSDPVTALAFLASIPAGSSGAFPGQSLIIPRFSPPCIPIDKSENSETSDKRDNCDKRENRENSENSCKPENSEKRENIDKRENSDKSENSDTSEKLNVRILI